MSGRAQLAEALKVALPTWQIHSHPNELDAIKQPAACVLWTERRTRLMNKGLDWFQDELNLWVLTATDKPSLIEDDLDDLLFQVMAALEPLDAFAWETAEREVLADKFNGYRLTLQCVWQMPAAEPEPEPEP